MSRPGLPAPPERLPRAKPSNAVVALLWGLRVVVVVLTILVTWSFVAGLGRASLVP
jgi:hypothetical protein